MKVKQNDQEYNRYVEAITPKHSCLKNCLHAFFCILFNQVQNLINSVPAIKLKRISD